MVRDYRNKYGLQVAYGAIKDHVGIGVELSFDDIATLFATTSGLSFPPAVTLDVLLEDLVKAGYMHSLGEENPTYVLLDVKRNRRN